MARSLFGGQVWDCAALVEDTLSTRAGAAIQISASAAGTVTLTLVSGSTIVVNVPIGDSIYPYQVVRATVGTATVTGYYNLFVGV